MQDATTRAKAAIGDKFSDLSKSVVNSIADMASSIEAWATDDLEFLYENAKRLNKDPLLVDMYSKLLDEEKMKTRADSVRKTLLGLFNDIENRYSENPLKNFFIKVGLGMIGQAQDVQSGTALAGQSIDDLMNTQMEYEKQVRSLESAIMDADMRQSEGLEIDKEAQRALITKAERLQSVIEQIVKLHSSTETLISVNKKAVKPDERSIQQLEKVKELYKKTTEAKMLDLKVNIEATKTLMNLSVSTEENAKEQEMLAAVLDVLIAKYNKLDLVTLKKLASDKAYSDSMKDLETQIVRINNRSQDLFKTGMDGVTTWSSLETGMNKYHDAYFKAIDLQEKRGWSDERMEIYLGNLNSLIAEEEKLNKNYAERQTVVNALSSTNAVQQDTLKKTLELLEKNKLAILDSGYSLETYEQAVNNVNNSIKDLNPSLKESFQNISMFNVGLQGLMEGLGGTMDFSALIEAGEAMRAFETGGSDEDSEEYATFMQAKIDATANMYSQLGGMAMQFLEEENARNEQSIRAEGKRELDSLKQTMKYKRASDAQKKVLEEAALKDSNDRLKKNFRIQQAMTISSILMDAASAMMKSVAGSWVTIGMPWAGMITSLAAAQIGLVTQQTVPTMKQGGLVGGNRHSQGGTMIEAEQGEFVMSRNAVDSVGIENLNAMNAGGGGGAVTVNVSGNVLSQDFVEGELAENIKEAIRRGTDFGIT